MAKDDYDVIVYKVLVYLYGCLKRKTIFEESEFNAAVKKNVDNDQYFSDVLRMMQQEGLLEGLSFTKVWGGEYLLLSDLRDAKITPEGIHYLEDNDKMKKVGKILQDGCDVIAGLAKLVLGV